ncbi:LCCL domain-containing protein CCP2 [Plasmodium ovale wallikeri]|uniref:LCCL domain-containing protein CCP2 n=1 Tax=Plasmodium ovale wallikeri TaxID=864142 RepID=A0A1A8ZFN0_PLAOA|nr:LCCL domain-containing protein CCP2 [Plasmodium ovale wallikeri]
MTKLFLNNALISFLLYFLFVNGDEDVSNTFFKFDNCEAGSTFSSIGDNGLPQYGAENALTRGSGYWCSEGKHNANDVVSWTGHLKNVRSINGIIIHWAYSPGEVSVLASFDGNEPFEEVVPYQTIESRVGNVVQNILFSHVIRAKSVRVNMRHPVHEYFGINFANVLGSKDPTLRIQSGMTSLMQDLCLQIDETEEVVLDGCITAMSYLDGRDLWKLNAKNQIYNPINNLCITLKDNMTANGGKIVMEDCNSSLEHNDGRSTWNLLPNNQLKISRDGNFCLSQDGSKSGSTDVALHKPTTSTLTRQDKQFSPDKAVDGNLDTFWASQLFTIDTVPDSTYFEINLGNVYKLQKCVIDWKYPPTKYSIHLSQDGENYKEVSSNLANFLRNTINNLHNVEAQFVKVKLMSPNPEFSEDGQDGAEGEEGYLLYGIRKLSLYTNRIKSIVEDCDKVKDSDDARDKYFFEFVSEVNLQEGKELKRLDTELQQYADKIQNEAIKIQKLNPQLKKCKSEKEKRHSDVVNIKNVILKNIYDVINQTENIIKMNTLSSYYSTSTNEIGQTADNPADNCFYLKKMIPSSPSGFYYVLPPCSQHVLRAFCDMNIGGTYYIPSIDTNIINKVKDVQNVCATYGLYPIHLHHEKQVYSLKHLFRMMDVSIDKPVPLAIRIDTESFFSLDLQENVNNIVSKFGTPAGNTFGINSEGVSFFDSSNSEMSAFVCSDNVNSVNLPEQFINLNCKTTLKDASDMDKIVGNEYLFKCPHDCLERDVEATVVGGEGSIYSEDSSICLSAIHAGVYDKHYLINIRIVNALSEYEGNYQNGIISESYINDDQEFGFKLFNVPPKCPTDVYVNPSFAFFEIENGIDVVESKENIYVDSSTADAINDLVTVVNKQVGSTDPTFLALINKQTIRIIANARRYLKPSENFEKNIELLSEETLKDVQKVSHTIKLLSSKITSELEKRKYKLEGFINERLRQKEFESWSLEGITDDTYDTFEISNSVQLKQGGKWTIIDNPLNEGMIGKTFSQNVRVLNLSQENNLFTGTYAFLRYKSFYDFVFSTYIHVKGTGSVGLIFRAYDKYNYYMLELNNIQNGFKRLLKVENNEPTELAIINDGGFDEGSWFAVRIECIASKIRVNFIKGNIPIYELPSPDIVINDDFNATGTIGFYTYGVELTEFTKPVVESVECSTKGTLRSVVSPLSCNVYEEFYIGKFNKSYVVSDPEMSIDGPSNWNYANNIGNEKHVIFQKSNIRGDVQNEIPSFVILQKRTCHNGIFNFSIYPQCSNGIVGALFKYMDSNNYTILEIGSNFTRLRQKVNGNFHLLAKSIISGYKENIWNRVTISFSSTNINVNMGSGLMTYPIFSLIGLNLLQGEQVGFSSYNCGNVAFSNIFLHPFDFKPYSPTPPTVGIPSKMPIFSKMSEDTVEDHEEEEDDTSNVTSEQLVQHMDETKQAEIDKHVFGNERGNNVKGDVHFCATHRDIVDRIEYCSKLGEDNPNCTNQFCKLCCDNIDSTEEEDIKTCVELCEKLDEKIVHTSEILNFLKKSCIELPSEKLKQSCQGDSNKDECLTEMCQMCCQSVTIPDHMLTRDADLTSLVNHCISMCV